MTWFLEDTRLIFPYNDKTQGGGELILIMNVEGIS